MIFKSMITLAGGVKVGSGGFAVMCTPSNKNTYNGYYSLDYLLTEAGPNDSKVKPADIKSLEMSLDRIQRVIREKIPSLLESFTEYKSAVFNRTDMNRLRIWEPTPFELINLDDQNFSVSLPENCKSEGVIKGIPAVIRQDKLYSGTSQHVIYKYVEEVVSQLKQTSPVQLSFLIVHEWLWDISSNVDRNRRVNRLLHSERIESMSSEDIVKELNAYGFYLPDQPNDNFDLKRCDGHLFTQKDLEDFYQGKYDKNDSFNLLMGTAEVQSRKRNIDCSTQSADKGYCQMLWQPALKNSRLSYPFKVFMHGPLFDFPIRMVSPELLQNNGHTFFRGQGNINCEIVDNSEYNLRCLFQDDLIFNAVTAKLYEGPYSLQSTILRGKLTDQCVRLEYNGVYEVENIGLPMGAPLKSTVQIQTVFQLLKPKF